MDVVNMNVSPSRKDYWRTKIKAALQAQLEKHGLSIDDFDMELQTIRKYAKVKDDKLPAKFDLKNSNNDADLSIVTNDVFIPFAYAIGLVQTPADNDGGFRDVVTQPIVYWPDPFIFNKEGDTGLIQFQALTPLYYATSSITAGNDNLITKFDNIHALRTPFISETESSYYYGENGVYAELTEPPVLNGNDQNFLKFDIPTSDTKGSSGDNSQETYVVAQLVGFNITDLAKPMTGMDCKCIK